MHPLSVVRRAAIAGRPLCLWAAPLLLALSACTGNVAVDGSWTAGVARQGSFANLLVVGISRDVNQRCAFENALVGSLRDEGVQATTSCSVLGIAEPLTREGVVKAAAQTGADAVIATNVVDLAPGAREGASPEARGGISYTPVDLEQYFAVTVVRVKMETLPSVFTIAGSIQLSTRLFETAGAKLVYSLDTRAKDVESRSSGLADITPVIARRLRRDGLLR